ncbi:MAG: DUF2865 domain-containing protein [Hyphomicrobiales bacterium]|nr:MAG: DUF2865 domain-containing protein [Hyphomicrobiales bacterium]
MRRDVLKTGGDEDGQGRTRLPLLYAGLVYLACVAVGILVVSHAVAQVGHAWLAHIVPDADQESRSVAKAPIRAHAGVVAGEPSPDTRAPHLSPTVERIKGDPEFWAGLRRQGRSVSGDKASISRRDRFAATGAFSYRPMARMSDDEDGEETPVVTYRTLCVRMCDGYYFPISFSAPQERFAADAAQCQSRCGSEARLFVHRNPGAAVEDMQDLQGRAYAQLPSAFLYRTQYVANCKCRPDPWEAQAREQHQLYALASAAKAGDPKAQAALSGLSKERREIALRAVTPPKPGARMQPVVAGIDGPPLSARVRDARSPSGDGERRMGLGRGGDGPPSAGPSNGGLPSWARAVFSAN